MARPTRLQSGRWRIRWFDHTGRRRTATYREYKEAQHALSERQVETVQILRGQRHAPQAPRIFNQLFDYWIEKRAALKRSGRDDIAIIRRHLRPALGSKRIDDLRVQDVDELTVTLSYLNPKTISNILTLLGSCLNLAHELEWIDRVPRIRKPRTRLFSEDFHYLHTDDEVRRFLASAQEDGVLVYTLYATALFTGMRLGELAALTWSDVLFDRRLIVVQRSHNTRTKSGDVRYVPLLDALPPILRAWRLRNPLPLVFPNAAGHMFDKSARIFQDVLHRVLRRAGFPPSERNGKQRPYITFHELRHSFASHWMMRGGDLFRLQRVLGHHSPQMTNRYAHLAPEAFAGNLDRLDGLVPHGDGQVVPLAASDRPGPCQGANAVGRRP
jgi:integrase